MIGTRLTEILLEKGHKVRHLGRTRHGNPTVEEYTWDLDGMTIEQGALDGTDVVVHLAGAGIAGKRWTKKRKKEIIDSRVQTARLLVAEMNKAGTKAGLFISPSAIGYYGAITIDNYLMEDAPAGDDFLAHVCKEGEAAAEAASAVSGRVVVFRIGFLLSDRGGALKTFALPVKFGVGAPLGTGNQWLSWVHLDDLCRMVLFAIENPLVGTFNAVAPNPVTNKEMVREIAKVKKRPVFLPPLPGFMLKLVLGEMATAVLEGPRVSSQKIQSAGFRFLYENIHPALEDLKRV